MTWSARDSLWFASRSRVEARRALGPEVQRPVAARAACWVRRVIVLAIFVTAVSCTKQPISVDQQDESLRAETVARNEVIGSITNHGDVPGLSFVFESGRVIVVPWRSIDKFEDLPGTPTNATPQYLPLSTATFDTSDSEVKALGGIVAEIEQGIFSFRPMPEDDYLICHVRGRYKSPGEYFVHGCDHMRLVPPMRLKGTTTMGRFKMEVLTR